MNEELIFISAKCITYGRVDTLVEALNSFLIQDYPKDKCELIIVNDCPFQTLIFEHPQVKIYNLKETFQTIGEKENYAIERCKGELIAVWDDDDIALSNHLKNIVKYWKKDNTNLLHWQNAVYYNDTSITKLMPVGNSGIVYSKKAWEQIGKSPIENAGGDMTMVLAMHNLGRQHVVLANPPDKECSWFYMWGGRGYHQSGMGTDVPERPNIIQRHSAYIEDLRKNKLIPEGIITLEPKWKFDYQEMLNKFTKK